MGKREEISDMLADKAYRPVEDGGLKVGHVLKFAKATLRVTKIDRKNKRCWAEHIRLWNQKVIASHTGHDVDVSNQPYPFCNDCGELVVLPSTEDGDVKALNRRDDEERNYLSDGTKIG